MSSNMQTPEIETPPLAAERSFSLADRALAHLAIARLDHSTKNIFVLPGIVVAYSAIGGGMQLSVALWRIAVGFVACTLIACSNYVLNEVLDAPYDRHHPAKRSRPAANGRVHIPLAYAQWLLMMIAGLLLGFLVSPAFAAVCAGLWVMGCIYNIPPVRTKDVPYLDVLSESINNPLRMLMGWYMITEAVVPPVSLLIAYWMIGAFFMALKRFSEYREIGNHVLAGEYRRSFRHYSEQSLLVSVTFYASAAMLFFGAFIARYHLELVLSFPFVALTMAVYFLLSFEKNSPVQHPEYLYREPRLMVPVVISAVALTVLLFINIPQLPRFFSQSTFAARTMGR
ncbi:MAG TPA: UbiA prenyltransferase family protein [Bryobacteraceae bacterium]|jgi:4-hydroxybenzoate polyprenyltransferase|nr:UbiA prenyltransferase family protein [Bryobacteraceae bacterium]